MSIIGDGSSRVYGAFTRFAPMKKIANWYAGKKDGKKTLETAISISAITSLAVKDGIGCYMYVTQSLNNKEIPDDRRNMVAAMDMVNGGFMIGAQILMFFGMKKLNKTLFPKIFDRLYGKREKEMQKRCAAAARLTSTENKGFEARNIATNVELSRQYKKIKEEAFNLFKFVSELAAATIIGKRVVVPLIATPVACSLARRWDAEKNGGKDKQGNVKQNTDVKLNTVKENSGKDSVKKSNSKIEKKLDIIDVQYTEEDDHTNLIAKHKNIR